jgi:hypothetical protein
LGKGFLGFLSRARGIVGTETLARATQISAGVQRGATLSQDVPQPAHIGWGGYAARARPGLQDANRGAIRRWLK